MGWLSEDVNGKEVLIGDEPLDIAADMLKKIAASYCEDVERKPTLDELVKTLDIALGALVEDVLADGKDKELSSITIRLKKLPKRQKVSRGDYFAVPLTVGGYGYGYVKDARPHLSVLADFFELRSETLLGIDEVRNAPVLFQSACSDLAIERREWPIIGNVPATEPLPSGTDRERFNSYTARLGSWGHGAASGLLELLLVNPELPRTRKITVGDHFAVPLESGGYGYARIKDIPPFVPYPVLEFLDIRSESLLELRDVRTAPGLFSQACTIGWEWPLIGNVPPSDGRTRERTESLFRIGIGGSKPPKRLEELLAERGR